MKTLNYLLLLFFIATLQQLTKCDDNIYEINLDLPLELQYK